MRRSGLILLILFLTGLVTGLLLRPLPSLPAGRLAFAPDHPPVAPPWRVSDPDPDRGDPRFADFAAWLDAEADGSRAWRSRGITLASARREALHELIVREPDRALRQALPDALRAKLPPEIRALLEAPVRADAQYEVNIACGLGTRGLEDRVERFVHADGRRYRVHTRGRRLDVTTRHHLSANGIAIGEDLALHESPVLIDGEAAWVFGEELPLAGIDVEAINTELAVEEHQLGPDRLMVGRLSTWTEGPKTLLYIRARFSYEDPAYEPLSANSAANFQNKLDQFIRKNAYGATSITSTITDTVTLPSDSAAYKTSFSTLLADARNAAKAANPAWDAADHDLYIVATSNKSGFSYAGKARLGSAGTHLRHNWFDLRTAGHEVGHNLGLRHANYWRTDSSSPIGRDSVPGGYVGDDSNDEWVEYGHRFSVMSAQSSSDMNNANRPHFAPAAKQRLDWLDESLGEVGVVTNSGLYRVYAHDLEGGTGLPRALHLDVPSNDYTGNAREYWLGYRRAFNSNWLEHGLQVDWVRPFYGSDGAVLLDLTPFSNDDSTGSRWTDDNNDKNDGVLVVGRTYSDEIMNIHFTPIAQGGTEPDTWMDVVVQLGDAPGNQPPVMVLNVPTGIVEVAESLSLSVNASDPDGDPLAVYWDFDDGELESTTLNQTNVVKQWSAAGTYVLRCVVSDTRGGVTSAGAVIRVGDPSNRARIEGQVTRVGQPVEGARVFVSNQKSAWTLSDGSYVLAGLAPGSHTVQADHIGHQYTPLFSNPVDVSAGSATGIDFSDGALHPPQVTLTGPYSNGTYTVFTTVFMSANASDIDGVVTGVHFHVDGAEVFRDDTAPWNGTWLPPATGSYDFTAVAWDNDARAATSAVTRIAVIEKLPPRPFLYQPQSGEQFVEGATIYLATQVEGAIDNPPAGKLQAGNGQAGGITVSFWANDQFLGVVRQGPYDFDWVNAGPPGVVLLTAVASEGGASGTSSPVQVSIVNDPPVVDITRPFTPQATVSGTVARVVLEATITDDGFQVQSSRWSRVSGPGSADFGDVTRTNTTVELSGPGPHVLRLTAWDTRGSGSGERTVHVSADGSIPPGAPLNLAPVIAAGPEQLAVQGQPLLLSPQVLDDGFPPPGFLSTEWLFLSGPAAPSINGHTVTFPEAGTHRLRLLADDREVKVYDELVVQVQRDSDGDGLPDADDPDDDNDGASDEWELLHGLDPLDPADISLDPDFDGLDNLGEFLADTNPTNALSVLKLEAGWTAGGERMVQFESSSNRWYFLNYCTSLTEQVWINLYTNEPGSGGMRVLIDSNGWSRVYYELGAELP